MRHPRPALQGLPATSCSDTGNCAPSPGSEPGAGTQPGCQQEHPVRRSRRRGTLTEPGRCVCAFHGSSAGVRGLRPSAPPLRGAA